MEIHKKYRWALTGLVIMIVLNAVTLFTIWVEKPDGRDWRQHRSDEHGRTAIHKFMKKELSLTEVQIDSMASLRRKHFQEMGTLRNELESKRRAYFDYIMSPESDDIVTRDSLMAQLTDQYIEVESALYTHMSEMKTVLNPEQQKRFKELMKETFLKDERRERAPHSKRAQ